MISTRPIFIISLNLYHRLNLQTHFTFNFKPRLFYNDILIWYWCLIAESTIPGHWIDYRPGRYYYWNKGLLLCWFKTRFIVGIQGMREMAKKDPWKSFFSPAFFVAVLIFLLNKKNNCFCLLRISEWDAGWFKNRECSGVRCRRQFPSCSYLPSCSLTPAATRPHAAHAGCGANYIIIFFDLIWISLVVISLDVAPIKPIVAPQSRRKGGALGFISTP